MNRPLYGFDRHMKAIRHGSIVRFYDLEERQWAVGHVWQHYKDGSWHVSFNHTYSESGQPIECGRDYRVIGDVEADPSHEDMLGFRNAHSEAHGIRWTPWPHWKEDL